MKKLDTIAVIAIVSIIVCFMIFSSIAIYKSKPVNASNYNENIRLLDSVNTLRIYVYTDPETDIEYMLFYDGENFAATPRIDRANKMNGYSYTEVE